MPGLFTLLLVVVVVVLILVFISGFLRYIPNSRVGIVEKLVSGRGSVKSGFIALKGEAGFQPDVLRGGWHLFIPFQSPARKCASRSVAAHTFHFPYPHAILRLFQHLVVPIHADIVLGR